jgi:ADP-heptose:LPS heptosyltransferase
MKAVGFNAGQFGDVVMGTVAARAHKLAFPDSKLTLAIAEKYSAVRGLFANHEYFEDIHVWKGYNDWPAAEDSIFLARERFDKVYNAMPQHTSPYWYLQRHQTAELCLMHGLTPPDNLQVSLSQPKSLKFGKTVALTLFGETRGAEKSITIEQAKHIVSVVESLGYMPIQLGLPNEPRVCTRKIGTFQESVEYLLTCHALITVDTAMAWIASGYSFPTVGLYGYQYYPLAKTAKNWQPVNPNAIYVESGRVSDIIPERIEEAIKAILK